ncbi:MAG: aminotransferase class V-fold PLP-dependent enzyme [Sphingopyxis sp.]|nr:aminotransferase class V-fold PLP-dependent enzyme [Sphingopyxis sp.]
MTCLPCQRDAFAIPRDVHYLNCAYMGPLPVAVSAAVSAGAALKSSPWTYRPADFFAQIGAYRNRAARLMGADGEDIALVPSASYGLAIAAKNLPLARGQNLVVLGDQFPSNYYVWTAKAADAGATVRIARREADDDWTAAVLASIDADTGIVAVPQCHWADGRLVDLMRVGSACRAVGAALVLDLTQSLGAMAFDAAAVQPDFAVAAGYKWQLSPYGTGMLYVAPRWQGGEPIEYNWLNRAGSQDFARLIDYTETYQPGARRFDFGECANPPLLMGACAALDLIESWGVANIAETLRARTDAIAAQAAALGLTAAATHQRAPHFLSLAFPGAVPSGLVERLAAANVHVSLRGTSLRVTPHLYNDGADAAALLAAL